MITYKCECVSSIKCYSCSDMTMVTSFQCDVHHVTPHHITSPHGEAFGFPCPILYCYVSITVESFNSRSFRIIFSSLASWSNHTADLECVLICVYRPPVNNTTTNNKNCSTRQCLLHYWDFAGQQFNEQAVA